MSTTFGNTQCLLDDDKIDKEILNNECGANSAAASSIEEACTTCASRIDEVILDLVKTIETKEQLEFFPMKDCAQWFIKSGASVKTLIKMQNCERSQSTVFANFNVAQQQKEATGTTTTVTTFSAEEGEEKSAQKANDRVLYCFLFFCSFPLQNISISEQLIPIYFGFIFLLALIAISVISCKILGRRRFRFRRRNKKEAHKSNYDNYKNNDDEEKEKEKEADQDDDVRKDCEEKAPHTF